MTAQEMEDIVDANHFPGFMGGQYYFKTLIEFRHQRQSTHGVPAQQNKYAIEKLVLVVRTSAVDLVLQHFNIDPSQVLLGKNTQP